jgi:putative ABC transport system substrate-binding protein
VRRRDKFLPLPACGERVGVRGWIHRARIGGNATSPRLLRNPTSSRAAGRGDFPRRAFLTLFAGAVVAYPLAARAQQSERVRRVGILMNTAADHPQGQARIGAFKQVLRQTGWNDGQNLRIDIRWGEDDVERDRRFAAELLALAPDVLLGAGTPAVATLEKATRISPIVFVQVSDPVGAGLVASLAKPGGNVTGFMNFEFSLSGKWLGFLKQVAPSITRVAVLRDVANPAGIVQFGAIQATASPLGVEVSPINVHDAGEIEQAIAAFARSPNGGLIVAPSAEASPYHDLIVTLAARHKLPAVYSDYSMVSDGGLLSYGPDRIEQFRQAARYVDRILKGEKPADLPVQAPNKFELVINLKTARALGIAMPPALVAAADRVIE